MTTFGENLNARMVEAGCEPLPVELQERATKAFSDSVESLDRDRREVLAALVLAIVRVKVRNRKPTRAEIRAVAEKVIPKASAVIDRLMENYHSDNQNLQAGS
jgi:hypothetical protein